MSEQLLRLPQKPGTVIAIGDWWLVRLRPYQGAPSAWELLPMPSKDLTDHAKLNGVKAQCVYGDEWVLAEVEQEGGYVVISDPRDTPSGIQYFTPTPALSAAPEEPRPVWDGLSTPPIGARVQSRISKAIRGEVLAVHAELPSVGAVVIRLRWDGDSGSSLVGTSDIEPEDRPRATVGQYPWKRGDRVKMELDDGRVWHGMVVEQMSDDEVSVRWYHHADTEDLDVVFPGALEREQ